MSNFWSGEFPARILYGSIWIILKIIQMPFNLIAGFFLNLKFILNYYIDLVEKTWKTQSASSDQTASPSLPVEKLTRISVKKQQEIRFLQVEQIYCIEANGDYVLIHTSDSKYLKDKTMKYWETHLPDDLFVRIHRSFIVNIEAIAKIELYEKESYKVQLKNGAGIKASAAGYRLLRQKM